MRNPVIPCRSISAKADRPMTNPEMTKNRSTPKPPTRNQVKGPVVGKLCQSHQGVGHGLGVDAQQEVLDNRGFLLGGRVVRQPPYRRHCGVAVLISVQRYEVVAGKQVEQTPDPERVVKLAPVDGSQHVAGHQGVAAQEKAAPVCGLLPSLRRGAALRQAVPGQVEPPHRGWRGLSPVHSPDRVTRRSRRSRR